MSEHVLVNRIDVEFNGSAIDSDFDFYNVKCDLKGKSNYGKVINKIYKYVKPLSMCRIKDGYTVMLNKGVKHSLNDHHYSVIPQHPDNIPVSTKAKLLIGALPVIQSESRNYSEGVGLYYLADIETIRNVDVLRTYEIKIEWEQQKHLVLGISSATFTPVSYHTNSEGELYNDCRHLPRFNFDHWTQELTRSGQGEYIRKKHRDKNMVSEMVSLDTKNPSKFMRSKMGVLATFMEDVKRHLSSYLSFRFETISPEYRVKFKDRDVKFAYTAINQLLSKHTINVINLTECDISELLKKLEDEKFTFTQSTTIAAGALNLAIHHDNEYCESKQIEDPYNSLHADKNTVIQSAYPETLIRKGKLSQSEYEACKKELYVKLEAASKELKFIAPPGNWLFVVCNGNERMERQYDTLRVSDRKLYFSQLDEDSAQTQFLLDFPRQLVNGEHAVVDLDSGEPYIFEDTKYVALPQYQELASVMNELTTGYSNGIKRDWIEEFLLLLDKEEVHLANPELVKSRLTILLSKHPSLLTFYKEDIFNDKENKITYKGSFQTFFDWILTEKGLRLAASLKGQDKGLIESSLGLFYNAQEQLYFIGDKDNVKSIPRFCRIRRILTDATEVPTELLQMMEVFHIRHKQATVYPFPFKHLREMSKGSTTSNS
ncbi:hypothetical protein [Colwellia sp. MEBiC06753]